MIQTVDARTACDAGMLRNLWHRSARRPPKCDLTCCSRCSSTPGGCQCTSASSDAAERQSVQTLQNTDADVHVVQGRADGTAARLGSRHLRSPRQHPRGQGRGPRPALAAPARGQSPSAPHQSRSALRVLPLAGVLVPIVPSDDSQQARLRVLHAACSAVLLALRCCLMFDADAAHAQPLNQDGRAPPQSVRPPPPAPTPPSGRSHRPGTCRCVL